MKWEYLHILSFVLKMLHELKYNKLSLSLSLFVCLSLSYTHTRARTHTHTYIHTGPCDAAYALAKGLFKQLQKKAHPCRLCRLLHADGFRSFLFVKCTNI